MTICFPKREAYRLPVFYGLGMPDNWPSFDWADPLLLDASLREEERLVRDSARNFAQGRLMPRIRDMHRDEKFDLSLLAEMGALGMVAAIKITW